MLPLSSSAGRIGLQLSRPFHCILPQAPRTEAYPKHASTKHAETSPKTTGFCSLIPSHNHRSLSFGFLSAMPVEEAKRATVDTQLALGQQHQVIVPRGHDPAPQPPPGLQNTVPSAPNGTHHSAVLSSSRSADADLARERDRNAPLLATTVAPDPSSKLKKLDLASSDEFHFTPADYHTMQQDPAFATSVVSQILSALSQEYIPSTAAGWRDSRTTSSSTEIGHHPHTGEQPDSQNEGTEDAPTGGTTASGRGIASSNLHIRRNKAPRISFDPLNCATTPAQNTVPKFANSYLKPNAKFVGEQVSDKARYYIEVQFKTVDLENSLVTGFLQITGLTQSATHITTYFKGEIINNPLNKFDWRSSGEPSSASSTASSKYADDSIKRYSFVTENKQWESSMKNDFEHWEILTRIRELGDYRILSKLNQIQTSDFQNLANNQFIYMRWKEEFLIPDSRIEKIDGASFDGFYFIVLNIGNGTAARHNIGLRPSLDPSNPSGPNAAASKGAYQYGPWRLQFSQRDSEVDSSSNISTPGSISGLYYHKKTEMLQSLSLGFVKDHGSTSTFQFC